MEGAFLKSLEGKMSGEEGGAEEAKMSMTNTFTAEMGLLSSLGRERVSHRVEEPGRTLAKLNVSKDPKVCVSRAAGVPRRRTRPRGRRR